MQNRQRSGFSGPAIKSLIGSKYFGLLLTAVAMTALASSSWMDSPAAVAPLAMPATMAAPVVAEIPAAAPVPVAEVLRSPVEQASIALSQIEIVVRRNDTLDGIFRRLKLNLDDLAALRAEPALRESLDVLRPGDAIHLTHMNGDVQSFVRRLNETETLSVTRENDGFRSNIIEEPLETRVAHGYGRIDSSLFEAADEAGISDQTAMTLAGIFGWDIDFVLDIRHGDEFLVTYEQIWQSGRYLRDGEIIAAQFINGGRVFRAVRYQLPDGSKSYYTPDGRSMRKAFLRAPVEFSRISSRFNPGRMHPILNRIRAHKGVDYAAPTGTPVRAAGDGRVVTRGMKGGYGRVVVLEHGNGISTLYGHLSRFAANVNVGRRVTQGEVIGYVGMSGLATGPHLHYEYRVNGAHVNPQRVKFADASPVGADLRDDFVAKTAPELAELELLERVRVASIN
ncbi:MAG TPA: peptidoglycan DD-metalloendopeptidase family protein [Steroidobacteraceae bacterium]|nr:peptidoglycan DD-metalloendopeptidase family protein [Steroidobacteraceae bacterium]